MAVAFMLAFTVVTAVAFMLTITIMTAVAFMLAFTVVMAMTLVLALAVVMAVTAAAMMRTMRIFKLLYFFLCGLAVHENLAAERDVFSSQRMVEVYSHVLVAYAQDASYEAIASFISQWDYGIFIHVGRVELAIFHEVFLGDV